MEETIFRSRRIHLQKLFYSTTILLASWFLLMSPVTAKTFESQKIENPTKVWNIQFNSEVTVNETTKNFIYIKTEAGDKHPLTLQSTNNQKTVALHPTKPFLLGKTYSIIIEKDIPSTTGKQLKEQTIKQFTVQGTYIRSAQAVVTPFATDVKVQATAGVAKITVSVNGNATTTLFNDGASQFSKGMQGLSIGDTLTIRAYDKDQTEIETQTYQIEK